MRYVLASGPSRFSVQAFARGLLSGLGHNPTFAVRDCTGELTFDPAAPAGASLRLSVQAGSLTLTDRVSAKDKDEIERRLRDEVLEIAAYPDITFHSTAVTAEEVAEGWYRLRVAGELRLHGVSKALAVEAQLRLAGAEARLSGQFTLSQAAYRIKEVSALGGLIKLKDELKFDFELVGQHHEG